MIFMGFAKSPCHLKLTHDLLFFDVKILELLTKLNELFFESFAG